MKMIKKTALTAALMMPLSALAAGMLLSPQADTEDGALMPAEVGYTSKSVAGTATGSVLSPQADTEDGALMAAEIGFDASPSFDATPFGQTASDGSAMEKPVNWGKILSPQADTEDGPLMTNEI